MSASIFRQHDTPPPQVRSDLYRKLTHEWVQLNTTTPTVVLRRWAKHLPRLANHSRLSDIVDDIDRSPKAEKDQILLALIKLFHDGHPLAGRVVLQAMLPGISTIRPSKAVVDTSESIEDRQHATLAEFWTTLSDYPHTRTTSVAANLMLDTLNRVSDTKARLPTPIAVDPATLQAVTEEPYEGDFETATACITEDTDIADLLTWGQERGHITTAEVALLTAVYVTAPYRHTGACDYATATTRFGISARTVRRRCAAATSRLTEAIRCEIYPAGYQPQAENRTMKQAS